MRFLLALFALCFSLLGYAQTVPAPTLAAKAWILVDQGSGQVLADHDPDTRIEPASLTKLMTAYLTFAALKSGTIKMDQETLISERAWRQEGSRMFVEPNTKVKVEDLIRGMITQSGNDACVALAELIAGSEDVFAQMMNREAARLGMKNTHFMNATGLPNPQHYTTARDLSLLAAALVKDFPEEYGFYAQKQFTYNKITQPNRNRLLWLDPTVDGMKTGHTAEAGYCLISSAKRGPRRLISVVLGTESDNLRAQESLKLLNYGFQFYDTVKLYSAKQAVSTVKVWKGQTDKLAVGFLQDFVLSLPKGVSDKLQASFVSTQPVLAPVQQGQEVGRLKLSADGKEIGDYPVVALEDAPVAGFFGRLWDALILWIKSL